MNRFVRKLTSTVCSAIFAVSALLPSLGRSTSTSEAEAYSNTQKFLNTTQTYSEIGPSPNIVTDFWGVEGPWCAMYVYFIAAKCGLADTHIPKYSYCDNQYGFYGYRNYYEDRGRFVYSYYGILPEPGDLIIFDTDTIRDGKGDHIGIVTAVDKLTGYISTIEGNGIGGGTYGGYYNFSNDAILGYCKTNLDGYSSGAIAPSEPVVPSQPAGPSIPTVDMSSTKWEVTSPVGCNLRATPDGEKLGILSTGTILNSDPSKNQGEWIYVKSAVTEIGAVLDGYIHCSTVMPTSNKSPVTTTVATTTATTTTTTTTTTAVTEAEITTTTASTAPSAPETTPQTPQIPANTPSHFISSLIGANGRTSAEFGDDNIARIIDTDTYLIINYYKNGFANCTIPSTGETYFIHTSTISELPPSGNAYTECARASHYVSSDCGVNLRAEGNYNGNILCILDTYQGISVLTSPNELGFVYVELTFGDGVVHNGYVHIDHISAY